VERIVDAGRRAPSAGFSQGQAFVIVTDADRRRRIATAAGEDDYVASGFHRWVSEAPVQVVLLVSEEAYHRRYTEPDKTVDGAEIEWPVPYWWVDAGASLMAMLLASVDEGLAAGFLGAHAIDELRAIVEAPAEFQAVGIVTIGHPAPDRRSASLRRGWRDRASVVHHERWT
jgi:nitroreductase